MTLVQIKKLHPDAILPMNAYGNDAGWDLHIIEDTFINRGLGKDVRTGVAVSIPPGWYGRIIGRSSAFRKKGLMVVEGIIDAGYTGELYSYVYCPVLSTPGIGVQLKRGESVAQLIVSPVPTVEWEEVDELPNTERGARGFGSSGR